MGAVAVPSTSLDLYRDEWVHGRLDYRRAADALEEAIRAGVERAVDDARRRLAEIEGTLAGQFDRFCGLSK